MIEEMEDLFHHTAIGSRSFVPNLSLRILAIWSLERVVKTPEPTDSCVLSSHATIDFNRYC